MADKVPMTTVGAELLRKELQQLKSVDRANVIKAIAEARAHGDLKENAEYHAAKEQQGFIEGRIAEVESKLAYAVIIDVKTLNKNGKVVFGSTVAIVNTATDEEIKYQIVGEDEADIKALKISVSSPIARALISKEEGDVVAVQTPGGLVEYEILSVQYI